MVNMKNLHNTFLVDKLKNTKQDFASIYLGFASTKTTYLNVQLGIFIFTMFASIQWYVELQEEEKFGNQMYTTKMEYWGQQGVSLKNQYMLGSP